MKTLDPKRVAFSLCDAACPECGHRIVRERITGRPGFERYLAGCMSCDWEQRVEVDEKTAACATIFPGGPADRANALIQETTMVEERKRCRCLGCTRDAQINGVCKGHYDRFDRWKRKTGGDLERFLQEPTLTGPIVPGKRVRLTAGASAIAAPPAERPKAPRSPQPRPPAPVNGHGAAFTAAFVDVELDQPVKFIRVGRIERFVTLTDVHGRVLHQMPVD